MENLGQTVAMYSVMPKKSITLFQMVCKLSSWHTKLKKVYL